MLSYRAFKVKLAKDLLPEQENRCDNYATAEYLFNKYKISKDEILETGKLINSINEELINELKIGYYVTDKAPSSFEELKKHKGQILPIYSGGSENTIYTRAFMNYNFRAVHDWHHITLDCDFSMEGESKAIFSHFLKLQEKMNKMSLSERQTTVIRKVFLADTVGQVVYYYKHKKFVENQLNFVEKLVNTWTCPELTFFKFKEEI